jgi:hypothetical protein
MQRYSFGWTDPRAVFGTDAPTTANESYDSTREHMVEVEDDEQGVIYDDD